MEIPDGSVAPGDIGPGADLSDTDLRGADLSGVNLRDADLSGTDLEGADLVGANLRDADLSGARLPGVDLTRVVLRDTDLSGTDLSGTSLVNLDLSGGRLPGADLSGANLRDADLSRASLQGTDLSGASLLGGNLSGASLQGATLSGANLVGTNLSAITIDQRTRIGGLCDWPEGSPKGWDRLARSYHALKTECRDNGLDEKARRTHSLERWARTREAWAARDVPAALAGVLSRFLTGYGTRVSYVLGWTFGLLILSTLWYAGVAPTGDWEGGTLYYSVVTLVASPPHPPRTSGGTVGTLTEAVVLFETYAGTALVVLSGYVLGNRDRV